MIFESKTMNLNFKNALCYLTFKELDKYDFIKHAYTTRLGGISENEFKSLNFSFASKDNKDCVNENYNIFCDSIGIDRYNLAVTSQVHENKICVVTKKNMKSGDEIFTSFEDTDGLITSEYEIGLVTSHADCCAIYMIDINKKIIGLAHAGWRGTVKNIAGKLAEKFINHYNSSPDDIISALGPSIGGCCFEVEKSLLDNFYSLDIPSTYMHSCENSERIRIDLLEVNRQLLLKAGIKDKNIFKSDICTMCNHDLLFSHRATKGKRGTNIAYLSLIS